MKCFWDIYVRICNSSLLICWSSYWCCDLRNNVANALCLDDFLLSSNYATISLFRWYLSPRWNYWLFHLNACPSKGLLLWLTFIVNNLNLFDWKYMPPFYYAKYVFHWLFWLCKYVDWTLFIQSLPYCPLILLVDFLIVWFLDKKTTGHIINWTNFC